MPADEVRENNRGIVRRYLTCTGEERQVRHELFTADGEAGLWTSDKPGPIVITGQDSLRDHAVWSLQCFPDWQWYNIQIFDTQDPEFFWAECDGRGAIRFEGYPEGLYENHFLHSFEFEDGRIRRQREFMNPIRQYEALGISVPEIVRAGIPT